VMLFDFISMFQSASQDSRFNIPNSRFRIDGLLKRHQGSCYPFWPWMSSVFCGGGPVVQAPGEGIGCERSVARFHPWILSGGNGIKDRLHCGHNEIMRKLMTS
jgi:hypothetical protein